MARVFTITPGLENMGGLKTGGQGSIYKGKRIGEIITAVKILPTPIYSESGGDSNYTAFVNEVAKLKKVNEIPNPHVVKILSSGLTEQGNFPYIEMEYIEGPDLQELLQLPSHSAFTINETLKVAEQLSEAIAHCHSMNVRHGDIKSNNVKLNANSGNYILLDFGLSIISDEQRKSTVNELGAIEFMAPEQHTGEMLFQTDVYSYGIVLFELLTGNVPFPLKTNGEASRNEVKLAHLGTAIPKILPLRSAVLPQSWSAEKKRLEMEVPKWLLGIIEKCLEKKPENRFSNGLELHHYFLQHRVSSTLQGNDKNDPSLPGLTSLVKNNNEVKKQLAVYKQQLLQKESELSNLIKRVNEKEASRLTDQYHQNTPDANLKKVSMAAFVFLMIITLSLGAYLVYPLVKKTYVASEQRSATAGKSEETSINSVSNSSTSENDENELQSIETPEADNVVSLPAESLKKDEEKGVVMVEKAPVLTIDTTTVGTIDSYVKKDNEDGQAVKNGEKAGETIFSDKNVGQVAENTSPVRNAVTKKYLVVSKAYFHDEPNDNNKRNEFISPVDKAVVEALNERYGFVYVVITNPKGQVFKGWLKKSELKLYAIE